jgi:A/G-specific adenine glycosylase
VLGYGADLAQAGNERELWAHADALLPRRALEESMPRYTQGLMDLGATVCLARNPSCLVCPASELCVARREGNPQEYPVKTRKLKRTSQALWLLRANNREGSTWLERRPATGIWAGLYCLPVFDSRDALLASLPVKAQSRLRDEEPFLHVLTHKDLHLHPVTVELPSSALRAEGAWFARGEMPQLGLPAPIRRLLQD